MTTPSRRSKRHLRLALCASSQAGLKALNAGLTGQHNLIWQSCELSTLAEHCRAQKPDLLLLEVYSQDCVDVVKTLMKDDLCVILLISTDENQYTGMVFEAMGYGALDVMLLPELNSGRILNPAVLERKIQNIALLMIGAESAPSIAEPGAQTDLPVLIAVGASAGGPATLNSLLQALPADFGAALILVQHLDDKFAQGMAEWLAQESSLPVRLALAGEKPQAGKVLLAGRNDHLSLNHQGELGYSAEPLHLIYRPSIDVFFESIARYWQGAAVGVLLTGMGNDGARGLKAMRERGFITIAQDQASSAVYGMPKAAIALDAAVEVLPLNQIAARLVALARY